MRRTLSLSIIALATLAAPAGRAQNRAVEQAARQLQRKAMQDDYLATDFAKAIDRLNQAIAKCGADKCPASLRAQLRRDLGVVLVGGQVNRDRGMDAWVEALRLDASLQLDADVRTKELEALFDQARQRAGGLPAGARSEGAPPPPAGDFAHVPVPEQAVRTPVPIYVEQGGTGKVVRVVVKYKALGMADWKTTELKALGKGYGGVIPCGDVLAGDLVYYVQGFDAQSDPVATSGDRNNAFHVTIKERIAGEPPHLPGQAPPRACGSSADDASADCPPGLPGCNKGAAAAAKAEGEDCTGDGECRSAQCRGGRCVAPEEGAKKFARLWVGVSGSFDLAFVPSAQNVCKLGADATPLNASGYFCTDSTGADFPTLHSRAANDAVELNQLNSIAGGAALGNVRVMVSADYAVTENLLVGGRIGFVFPTYPGQAAKEQSKKFIPLYAEARGTYVFGKDALANAGFAPLVLLGFGVSEYSANLGVNVIVDGATPPKQAVQAWYLSGPGFVTAGPGVRYAVAPRAALTLSGRFTVAFGNGAVLTSFAPELGVQMGF